MVVSFFIAIFVVEIKTTKSLQTMSDIHSLKKQISTIDEQLKTTILNAIQEIAKTQSVNKINRYTMTVKFSELSKKKVLSPLYYNWECSADVLCDILKNKSGMKCYDYIMSLPEISERTLGINREFVLKVIEYLQTTKK